MLVCLVCWWYYSWCDYIVFSWFMTGVGLLGIVILAIVWLCVYCVGDTWHLFGIWCDC